MAKTVEPFAEAEGEALDVRVRVFEGAEDGLNAERERAAWDDDAGFASAALVLPLMLTPFGWRHAEAKTPG